MSKKQITTIRIATVRKPGTPGHQIVVPIGVVEKLDFADFSDFMVEGLGIASHDVKPDSWTRVYGCVTGIYTGGEQEALTALRLYQKQLRHHTAVQDEMIMLNTWGDRSQDARYTKLSGE